MPLSYEIRSFGYTVLSHVLHFSPPPPKRGAGLADMAGSGEGAEREEGGRRVEGRCARQAQGASGVDEQRGDLHV